MSSSGPLATGATQTRTDARRNGFATAPVLARWLLGGAAFGWYTAFSLQAHARHLGSFDLAIFTQAVSRLAHLQAPVSSIKGFDLFGDHFHPIIGVVAPFYRLFPHAGTLLVVQAAALAASVIVVTKALQGVFGPRLGLATGFAYAISWGLQSALAFGFHEVSLGVPLIAASAACYLRRDWITGSWWAASLLLVKEDMAFTVFAFVVYLWIRRQHRLATVLACVAAAWFVMVVVAVMPALNPWHRYLYWPGGGPAQWTPGQPRLGLDASTLWSWQKVLTLVLVLAPMLFLALRNWLGLVLAPTLGWRFASANPHYWGTGYHYSEILMPITFLAGAGGAAAVHARLFPARRRRFTRVLALGVVAVGIALLAAFPFGKALTPGYWQPCPRCAAADAALAAVPADVTVAADDTLLASLVDRDTVHVLAPGLVDGLGHPLRPDYIVIDIHHTGQYDQPGWLSELRSGVLARDYTPVFTDGGYIVYRQIAPRG